MSLFFNSRDSDKRLLKLPIEKISPNPYQPRKNFDSDSINSLADSIAKYGVIQPITVRTAESGGYELVAGERRLRAARIAGLSAIPCILIRAGERRSAELAMTENLQRCDLDIFEEAEAIERLLSAGNITQAKLADELCMSQSSIANKLRLLRLDPKTRNAVRKHRLTERHARALLRVPPEKRAEIAEKVGARGLSVTGTEEYIDKVVCTGMAKCELAKKASPAKKAETAPANEKSAAPSPIRRFVVGDLTLFYNSLDRSLALMKAAGFDASLEKTEKDDSVFLSITLRAKSEKTDR